MVLRLDENANPKTWTPDEIRKAIAYIDWQLSNFGMAEASVVIANLMKKYDLKPADFVTENESLTESAGV